jgi:DNA repair photolyase
MGILIERREKPFPHYLVSGSQKKIHGWYSKKYRECTSERLLLNPYCGCQVGCFYCYARALPGYYSYSHRNNNIAYVFKDFNISVKRQLDSLNVASCGYLSPVSDPFQKINDTYRLSEKIIKVFVDYNLPIEFITKMRIPQEAVSLLQRQKHSFGQVSILTLNERLRKIISPLGADTEELLNNFTRLKKAGVF